VATCEVPRTRTRTSPGGDRSFTVAGLRLWNNLPFLPLFLPYDSELTLVAFRRLLQTTLCIPDCRGYRCFYWSALACTSLLLAPRVHAGLRPYVAAEGDGVSVTSAAGCVIVRRWVAQYGKLYDTGGNTGRSSTTHDVRCV